MRHFSAAEVLHPHLRTQVQQLRELRGPVRADEPDAVHRMRVTTRRLRSALATFRPMLTADSSRALRDELKWLAGVLGEARDAEVLRDRLAGLGPQELAARLDLRHDEGIAHVRQALDSPPCLHLFDALDALVEEPPWAPEAQAAAHDVLGVGVRRDWKRLARRAKAAGRARTDADRDLLLHEVRKATKRLRHAAEVVVPVFGSPADHLAAAAKRLQKTLGEHQDSARCQQLLREFASETTLAGDAELALLRLLVHEQVRAERAREQYGPALDSLRARRPSVSFRRRARPRA
ncbi:MULTISPECIES: CHAD domain-containing protein [unclassified Nocardioides]|uniref:CHAD domain-containing protein n=1 Tax=unclassified Nocardioides TaxID=2615069 RepID=UPI000701DDB7|nr:MULTISPECIES: CHAD domain-containing protein [unclassified Nocardioides]KQY56777.1 hypothetical protein ASD30_10725 [Nocardioides sp. Root140]KQZ67027.1 hypothetical protein ASD66_18715 [Nocardioides sp. Root151]KRF12897.1 hypothetical protein ASH02_15375 [Nocardioides sp. Soil796]